MSFVAVLFTVIAMANNGSKPVLTIEIKKIQELNKSIVKENVANLRRRSCTATQTVTINGQSATFTTTVTCNCSVREACIQANSANTAIVEAFMAMQ